MPRHPNPQTRTRRTKKQKAKTTSTLELPPEVIETKEVMETETKEVMETEKVVETKEVMETEKKVETKSTKESQEAKKSKKKTPVFVIYSKDGRLSTTRVLYKGKEVPFTDFTVETNSEQDEIIFNCVSHLSFNFKEEEEIKEEEEEEIKE